MSKYILMHGTFYDVNDLALMHANHKYIKREKVSGKWVYTYADDLKGLKSAAKAQQATSNRNKILTAKEKRLDKQPAASSTNTAQPDKKLTFKETQLDKGAAEQEKAKKEAAKKVVSSGKNVLAKLGMDVSSAVKEAAKNTQTEEKPKSLLEAAKAAQAEKEQGKTNIVETATKAVTESAKSSAEAAKKSPSDTAKTSSDDQREKILTVKEKRLDKGAAKKEDAQKEEPTSNLAKAAANIGANVGKTLADAAKKTQAEKTDEPEKAEETEKASTKTQQTSSDAEKPKSSIKSVKDHDAAVDAVLNGEWGNGKKRWDKLTEAGYDWEYIQNKVNEKLGNKKRRNSKLSGTKTTTSKAATPEVTTKATETARSFNQSAEEFIKQKAAEQMKKKQDEKEKTKKK